MSQPAPRKARRRVSAFTTPTVWVVALGNTLLRIYRTRAQANRFARTVRKDVEEQRARTGNGPHPADVWVRGYELEG